MTKILIINTGGTIAMSEDHLTGKVSPSEQNPLKNMLLAFDLHHTTKIDMEELFSLPSPHMTEVEMLLVQRRIKLAKKQGYTGIVVTHGTDTLEETAYFLDLTLDGSLPVVVTGAMRSSNEIGSDGIANLRSAIIVASDEESKKHGVLVVMNEEVHSAAFVTKTHTTNLATFQTPTFGPIGLVSKNKVLYFQKMLQKEYYPLMDLHVYPKIYLLKAYAGMDGSLIEAIRRLKPDGIVIEALGAGNLPPKTVPVIESCLKEQIPIVFVSRAFNGVTQDVYDYVGGGKQFKQAGVIFSNGLSGQKARMKLFVLKSLGIPTERLAEYFE